MIMTNIENGIHHIEMKHRTKGLGVGAVISILAAEAKLMEQVAEVEQYIRTIEDSRMRRIIQYRVIDGLSWYEVADRIGGKATSESCRKYFERFLGKC